MQVDDRVVQPVGDQLSVTGLLTKLDRGEAEAIILAKELAADALLIDEREGRAVAEALGIRCVGLAGALHAEVPLGTVTRDFLDAAIAHGMADTDYSRLYERFEEIVAAVGHSEKSS